MTTSKADDGRAKADDGDWLGYGAYADALWGRVVRALDQDQGGKPLGDDPLVIGIFGEWGAGKSALLKLVNKRAEANLVGQIAARADDSGFSLTVPVWFQPWKYEHEEHLHVPMVVHVLNALKDALKQDPTVVQSLVETGVKAVTIVEKATPAIAKGAKVAKAIFPIAKKILKSISFFGVSIDLPDDLEDWLEAAADAGGAKEKAKDEAAKKEDKSAIGNAPKHMADGSYFYRIHELLGALTRPGTYEKRKSLFDHAELTPHTRINFVIFIDDLDRCLPEKAVQTLELIKTVFNTESFAFVLALDEEVIERGIGHRYKDYFLHGKKPDMPITGFEYLEKIVHLPFKLPAVTASQARNFVLKLEEQIAPKGPFWFKPLEDLDALNSQRQSLKRDSGVAFDRFAFDPSRNPTAESAEKTFPFDLLSLALRGFDAYVPRKLARLVELWHTTVQVAILRNQADSKKEVLAPSSAAQVDIRIVLTLLMVQIFHPDLYRVFRRHEETFQTLYNGFDSTGDNLSPSFSDIDLWHWAAYKFKEKGKEDARPMHLESAVAMISKLDDSQRYPAQQKRLPLVECIIAHRKAQRHVFDALKLFSALKQQMPALPHGFKVGQYFSLLAEYDPALTPPRVAPEPAPPRPDVAPDTSLRFTPVDAQQLYLSLIAADVGTQEALVEKAQLEQGKFLTKAALEQLVERVTTWLGEANVGTYVGRSQQAQLLNGLQYLAPYIAQGEGKELWKLVADRVDITQPTDPKLRALWGDVRHALGCDDRFDPQNFYLLKDRFFDHGVQEEPLIGFVHVPAGKFTMGGKEDKDDNPPGPQNIDNPFYISRTLVTVDQYAAFICDKGYAEGSLWWDQQGIEWRNGSFDSKVQNEDYKKHLGRRTLALRSQPMQWEAQKAVGSRPVWGVNWFEARAYARWLDAQLAPAIGKALGAGYAAMLPTELQWERAARAASLSQADGRTWPWGNQEFDAEQHANLNQTIGSVCAVGLFPPSPIGLLDMAGNTWEWMDNLNQAKVRDFARVNRDRALVSEESLEKSDLPALRGGSWFNSPDHARCSLRNRIPPDYWLDFIGFRVVLSLAN